MLVDSDTQLDDMKAVSKTEIGMYLTLLKISKNDPDLSFKTTTIEEMVRKSACTNANYKTFFEAGVSVLIFYKSNDGTDVLKVHLNPKDCG